MISTSKLLKTGYEIYKSKHASVLFDLCVFENFLNFFNFFRRHTARNSFQNKFFLPLLKEMQKKINKINKIDLTNIILN